MAKFKVGDIVNVVWLTKPEWKVVTVIEPDGGRQMYEVSSEAYVNTRSVLEAEMKLLSRGLPALAELPTEYHKSILLEAESLVNGDRNEDYGHPLDDFTKTAALWSVIANIELAPSQVALMMVALKISRQLHRPKRDNLVDMAGYAETAQMVVDEIDRRADVSESFGKKAEQ